MSNLQALSSLVTILQAATNSLNSAQTASKIILQAKQEGRDLTDEDWQRLDDFVAQARAQAVAAAS